MNTHSHTFTTPRTDPQGLRAPTVDETDAATAEMQSFMLANPEVAFAETIWRGWRYTFRLIAVLDGDEYEGTGHTMYWALRVSADSKRQQAAFARNMAANPAIAGLVAFAREAM